MSSLLPTTYDQVKRTSPQSAHPAEADQQRSLSMSQGPSTSSLEPVNKVSSIDELIRGLEGQANQNAQPSPHHVSFAKSSHNTNGQACNNSEDVMTNMEVCIKFNRGTCPYDHDTCHRRHVTLDARSLQSLITKKHNESNNHTYDSIRHKETRPPIVINTEKAQASSDVIAVPDREVVNVVNMAIVVKLPQPGCIPRRNVKRRRTAPVPTSQRACGKGLEMVDAQTSAPFSPSNISNDTKVTFKISLPLPHNRNVRVKYCNDWQQQRCHRVNCKYVHAMRPVHSQSQVSVLHNQVTSEDPGVAEEQFPQAEDYTANQRESAGTSYKGKEPMYRTRGIAYKAKEYKEAMPPNVATTVAASAVAGPSTLPQSSSSNSAVHDWTSMSSGTHKRVQSYGSRTQVQFKDELVLTLFKSTRVTIGSGLQVLNVLTSFESPFIVLGNVPANVSRKRIRDLAGLYGEVVTVFTPKVPHNAKGTTTARIQYRDPTQAARAVSALHGSYNFYKNISARLSLNRASADSGSLSDCIVRLDLPTQGRSGYVGYLTEEEAQRVVSRTHGTAVRGQVIAAHIYNGLPRVGTYGVRYDGLPYDIERDEVFALGGEKVTDGVLTRPGYKFLRDAANTFKLILSEYGNVINVDVPMVPPVHGRSRLYARFASADGAASACEHVNGRRFHFIGGEKVYLDHLHSIRYVANPDVASALFSDLRELQGFARSLPGAFVTIQPRRNGAVGSDIELGGTDLASLKQVKAPLERMLAGEKMLDEENKPVWNDYFASRSGATFLTEVSKSTGTHIYVHKIMCTITIWGSPTTKTEARSRIFQKHCQIRDNKLFYIPITIRSFHQIIKNHLDKIRSEVGEDDAVVEYASHRLVVRGEDKHKRVLKYLADIAPSLQLNGSISADEENVDNDATCPICLDSVVEGITLDCGHKSCRQCLEQYLSTASSHKSFPLKCLGDSCRCSQLIPLRLCQSLLSKEQFSVLVNASFTAYIKTRPREFAHCPTADCPQIYRLVPKTILQCPSCLVEICPDCHEKYHDNEECYVTIDETERLFRRWKASHNVKRCPTCKSEIEKVAGCNHVTCSRCGTHICWYCGKTFDLSDEVYEHMHAKHGGIGI